METVFDQFKMKSGSKYGWPSNDPEDSPYDNFTCKLCDKNFRILMNGTYGILTGQSFTESALVILRTHLLEHCKDDFLKDIAAIKMCNVGEAFDMLLVKEIKRKD